MQPESDPALSATTVTPKTSPDSSALHEILSTRDQEIVTLNSQLLKKDELQGYINNLMIEHESEIFVSFDKNLSYDEYIKNKIFMNSIKITKKGILISNLEYIF